MLQNLQDRPPQQCGRQVVVIELGSMPGFGAVAETARSAPFFQRQPNSPRLAFSVFPQTGLVQVFEIDPTDVLTNATGAAGADGLADNIFNFAQQGMSAGR